MHISVIIYPNVRKLQNQIVVFPSADKFSEKASESLFFTVLC